MDTILYCVIIVLIIIGTFLKYFNKNTQKHSKLESARTLICIGSGGHTAEMMRILKKMDLKKYSPRAYVMANDDTTSEVKVNEFESDSRSEKESYSILKIYRSRKVGQSYFGSVFTTLYATVMSIPLVYRFRPDVILCNGPGTCIPICVIAYVMSVVKIIECKIVFVESVCRVKSISLSGKILLFIADVFAVQWEELSKKHSKIQYFGKLS